MNEDKTGKVPQLITMKNPKDQRKNYAGYQGQEYSELVKLLGGRLRHCDVEAREGIDRRLDAYFRVGSQKKQKGSIFPAPFRAVIHAHFLLSVIEYPAPILR